MVNIFVAVLVTSVPLFTPAAVAMPVQGFLRGSGRVVAYLVTWIDFLLSFLVRRNGVEQGRHESLLYFAVEGDQRRDNAIPAGTQFLGQLAYVGIGIRLARYHVPLAPRVIGARDELVQVFVFCYWLFTHDMVL